MKIYAFFMVLGCFLTLLIPETKRLTLEHMAAEAEDIASDIPGGHAAVNKPEAAADSHDEKIATG